MKRAAINSGVRWLVVSSVVVFVIIVSLFVVLAFAYSGQIVSNSSNESSVSSGEVTAENCVGNQCLSVDGLKYPVSELPPDVAIALHTAIDDEYKAYSTYSAVAEKMGQVHPFSVIIASEESHIVLLRALLDKYGETVSDNAYAGNIVVSEDSLEQNCQIAYDLETVNVSLYEDDLLPRVEDYPDITNVFTKLMNDSKDKHLSAFDGCK